MAVFDLQSPLRETAQIFVPAPTGGYNKGDAVVQNDVIGFALNDADPLGAGDESLESQVLVTVITEALLVRALKVTGAINRGEELFYDSGDAKVTTSSTGNTYCGYACESVSSSATSVLMRFQGGEND